MAEVTITPDPTIVDTSGYMNIIIIPIKFLLENIIGIIFIGITVMFLIIALYFLWSKEEEKKEQEDMLYKEYKDTIRSCKSNQDEKMYMTFYSKWNWLVCMGLPLIKYKQGRKVFNKRQQLLGYYDGSFTDQLGNVNILMWKTKSFLILKDHFILRLPTNVLTLNYTKKKNDRTGKQETVQKITKVKLDPNLIQLDNMDKTIFVSMVNHQKTGYYYYPVYQDGKDQTINLSETINTLDEINHGNMLVHQVIKEGGKNVINMSKQNTSLQYEIRSPEKVKEVDKED